MKKKKILLIIPAYNESENILRVCKGIKACDKNLDYIVINDCSTDNTEEICRKNKLPHINLVHNLGIGGAVQTGYKYAKEHEYDIAIQFDGDGQHDVNYVKNLVEPLINGECDMAIGSRFIEEKKSDFQSTFARRVGINMISWLMKLCTGKKITDTTSGFRACNKEIINYFVNDYPIEYPEPVSTVGLLKHKYRIKEVPVEMKERIAGTSSIKTWKTAYYMINVMLSIIVISMRRY